MALPETIEDAIEQNAIGGKKSVTINGDTVTAMTIAEQIEAARYLSAKIAAAQSHFGLRFTKLVPPGAG